MLVLLFCEPHPCELSVDFLLLDARSNSVAYSSVACFGVAGSRLASNCACDSELLCELPCRYSKNRM